MRYVSLHHHSTFSYLDGFQLPEAHIRRATEIGMTAMALTEHGNVSSHVQLEKASQKQGVKALYGCELYTGDVGENATQRKNHLTVLAENEVGYQNLLRVVSQGWSDFYYEPTVSGEVLGRYRKGLVILSGCTGSLLATSLVGGKNIAPEDASYRRGRAVAQRFKRVFGDAYYLEVQAFPELENVCKINQMLARVSEELDIPLVATGDVHYTLPSESEIQAILHNVRPGKQQTLEDQMRSWGYDVPLCPPSSDKNIFNRLRGTGLTWHQARDAILSTEEIAQRCSVTLPKLERLRFPVPGGYQDASEVWKDWIRKGWRYRNCHTLPATERNRYKERLLYEMSIIEQKDYTDYFLVVSDLVKFAKDSGIPVGPARGSAAASLVCYLLRITEVDPMLFPSLVFERFIDITREDLPDIDLDFDSERRHEIRDYLVGMYGPEQVSNIGTFTQYKSKNSLDDVARVYRIPKYEVETVKELLLERSSGDLRASATIEDTVEQFEQAAAVFERYPDLRKAMDLEGNVKSFGIHAAGLVVSNGPITDVCAVYRRKIESTGEVNEVISLDKIDAERQGLIKIDVLGLSTMTMIAESLRLLDMKLEDLYDLPLDDEAVIDSFRTNDVVGIFQFDGRAMRSVNSELQPDNFKEICDVNALARPGPLHNNASAEYIDIKQGRKVPAAVHPLLDGITKDTHYQIVYQEQILRIVREIGGFDWTAAAYIRKIISKKLGEQEFNRQWEKFKEGAVANGVEEELAKEIWGHCITAGAYAFNAAHCVSYGMLAYWCMWIKVHHPQVFYVASLQKLSEEKQLDLLRDATRHGIEILPPHPAKSQLSWTIDGPNIRAGFTQVPGIGDKVAAKIMEFRGSGVVSWQDLLEIKGIGPKKVQTFEDFAQMDDPFRIFWLQRRIEKGIAALPSLGLPKPTHTSLEVPYSRGKDEAVTWLGVVKHRNLRELFEVNFSRTGVALDPETVKDPHLNEWVIMVGADDEELLTITIDRWRYPRFKRAIWGLKLESDLVLVKGVKRGFQSRRAIYVKDMYVIDPED